MELEEKEEESLTIGFGRLSSTCALAFGAFVERDRGCEGAVSSTCVPVEVVCGWWGCLLLPRMRDSVMGASEAMSA